MCHFSPWCVCKKHPDTIDVHTNIFFAKKPKVVAIYFHECLTVLQPLLIIFLPHIFCDLFHRLHCSKHTKNAHHYKQLVIIFSKRLTFYCIKRKRKKRLCAVIHCGGGGVVNTVDQQVLVLLHKMSHRNIQACEEEEPVSVHLYSLPGAGASSLGWCVCPCQHSSRELWGQSQLLFWPVTFSRVEWLSTPDAVVMTFSWISI